MINLTLPALTSEPTSVVDSSYYFFVFHCTRLKKRINWSQTRGAESWEWLCAASALDLCRTCADRAVWMLSGSTGKGEAGDICRNITEWAPRGKYSCTWPGLRFLPKLQATVMSEAGWASGVGSVCYRMPKCLIHTQQTLGLPQFGLSKRV